MEGLYTLLHAFACKMCFLEILLSCIPLEEDNGYIIVRALEDDEAQCLLFVTFDIGLYV